MKQGYKPKPKEWKSFEKQLLHNEEEQNTKNMQIIYLIKDRNGCLEVHIQETTLSRKDREEESESFKGDSYN